MSARGLVLSDGAGATELGVSQERAKVALFGPDGTIELCAVDGASSTAISYLPVAARDRGLARLRALNVDCRGSLELGTLDIVAWDGVYSPTTIPDRTYVTTTSAFVPTYATDGYRLNPAANTGNGAYAAVKSVRTFPLQFGAPLTYIVRAKVTPAKRPTGGATAGAGVFSEIGFWDSGTPANSNLVGAYFQIQNGVMIPVVVTAEGNGTARSHRIRGTAMEFSDFGGQVVTGLLDRTAFYEWQVIVDPAGARFIIRGESGVVVYDETIRCPATIPRLWTGGVATFQAGARHYNLGNPVTAGDLHMTESVIGYYGRSFQGRTWAARASEHRPIVNDPNTQTAGAQWTNSAEPASMTLAQVTPAGGFGFGGKFQFAAPAGATTDYGIGSNPNQTSQFTGVLNITGLSIDAWNVGAAVAGTPTHLQWYIIPAASGATAASLSRFALGSQSFPVGTPVGGTPDQQIVRSFQSPIVMKSSAAGSRWFTIGCRVAVGTATASQVIAGFWSIEGYWE